MLLLLLLANSENVKLLYMQGDAGGGDEYEFITMHPLFAAGHVYFKGLLDSLFSQVDTFLFFFCRCISLQSPKLGPLFTRNYLGGRAPVARGGGACCPARSSKVE